MRKQTSRIGLVLVGLGLVTTVQSVFGQQELSNQQVKQPLNTEESSEDRERRLEFERMRVVDPITNEVPTDAYWQAVMLTKQMREFSQSQQNKVLTWTERGPKSDVVGPSNGNTRANSGITAGRVRTILPDAADATGKKVWVGGIDGGLWKTNDITASPAVWTPVNDYLSNLAITDICQNPANLNTMYFCTGEAYGNADAVKGAGVFKSTDGGVTWTQLSSTSSYGYCTRILCDYLGNVYLGTKGSGLRRSTDGGATWTAITPTGTGSNVCDLEISSTSAAGRLHVVMGISSTQYYRYVDSPNTATTSSWSTPTTGFPSYTNRAEIACLGSTLYACPVNASNQVPQIYKSTNGGQTWSATSGNPTTGWCNAGWYAVSVGIDPSNANNVMVGGLELYGSTNGGTSWTKKANWVGTSGQYVHADIHDIVWYNSGNKLLIGCDGGVHYSSDKGTTIRDRNNGLRIKQFYSVAVHPTSTNYMIGGTQDNGTHQLNGAGLTTSVEVTGGDGAYVAIDNNQPQYQFGAYIYNQYRRSTNSGSNWSSVNISSTKGLFINPFDYDDSGNILYACYDGGTYLRWSNPQTGSTTTSVAISNFGTGKACAIKVSPYTSNRVYFGTTGGRIVQVNSANATTPTSSILSVTGMPTGYVSCINVGANDNELIASYSSYNVSNVWVSLNGGTSWTAVDGNLPNMPVRWCMFVPGNNDAAIIATETGVWETTNLNGFSTVWVPSNGFPNVRVDMLDYRASDGMLAAATHGRGIYTCVIGAKSNQPTNLTSTPWSPSTMKVQWDAVTEASTYDVAIRMEGESTWTNIGTTKLCYLFLEDLAPDTRYDWKLIAKNGAEMINEGEAQFVTPADLIPCPGLTEMRGNHSFVNAETIAQNAVLKGALTEASGNFYTLELAEEAFGSIKLDNAEMVDFMLYDADYNRIQTASGDDAKQMSGHFNAGTYYLQIAPKANMVSHDCYSLRVDVKATSQLMNDNDIPMHAVESTVRLYPNPSSAVVFISTTDELDANSEIAVYDMSGRLVSRRAFDQNPYNLDVTELMNGNYMIAIRTKRGTEMKKLVVEH